ncbi:hypothetical protein ACH5RR_029354 [Cinchona calisaya]|uniref:RNase H type-1 domain-containing protein n=1 Tax=Cinchona calisaya TaxID=153742 RepID=A0ABD2YRH4_9GENT
MLSLVSQNIKAGISMLSLVSQNISLLGFGRVGGCFTYSSIGVTTLSHKLNIWWLRLSSTLDRQLLAVLPMIVCWHLCLVNPFETSYLHGLVVTKRPKAFMPILIYWKLLPTGSVKLNVDGSLITSSGLADGRGLVRDSNGLLLRGFACSFGHQTIMAAKAMSQIEGINLCLQLGYTDIKIETNSLALCRMILEDSHHPWRLDALNRKAKNLSPYIWFSIVHIYREANRAVHFLTKLGSEAPLLRLVFDSSLAPQGLHGLVQLDAAKTPSVRLT